MGPGPGQDQLGLGVPSARQARPERRRRHATGAEHVGVGEEHLDRDALAVELLEAGVGVVGREQAAVARLLLELGGEGASVVLVRARRASISAWWASKRSRYRGSRYERYRDAGGPAWPSAETSR